MSTTASTGQRPTNADLVRGLEELNALMAAMHEEMTRNRPASDRIMAEAQAIGKRTDRRLEDLGRLIDRVLSPLLT